jgi:hypothetical protein
MKQEGVCVVAGHADVHAPQSYLLEEDPKPVVAGRTDARLCSAQAGQSARAFLHVASTLEPNVRGQRSTGCESPPPSACGSA